MHTNLYRKILFNNTSINISNIDSKVKWLKSIGIVGFRYGNEKIIQKFKIKNWYVNHVIIDKIKYRHFRCYSVATLSIPLERTKKLDYKSKVNLSCDNIDYILKNIEKYKDVKGLKGKITMLTRLRQNLKYKDYIDLIHGFSDNNVNRFGRIAHKSKHKSNIIGLPKELRNYIMTPFNYYEIDIKSCHPSIYIALCDNLQLQTKYLRSYVKDREAFAHKYNIDPIDLKIGVLTLIYGGYPFEKTRNLGQYDIKTKQLIQQTLFKDIGMLTQRTFEVLKKNKDPIVKSMFEFFDKEIHSSKRVRKVRNLKGKMFSRFIQHIESLILDEMIDYFKTKNFVPAHDGIYLKEAVIISKPFWQDELKAIVLDRLNVEVNFSVKKVYSENPFKQLEKKGLTSAHQPCNEYFLAKEIYQEIKDSIMKDSNGSLWVKDDLGWTSKEKIVETWLVNTIIDLNPKYQRYSELSGSQIIEVRSCLIKLKNLVEYVKLIIKPSAVNASKEIFINNYQMYPIKKIENSLSSKKTTSIDIKFHSAIEWIIKNKIIFDIRLIAKCTFKEIVDALNTWKSSYLWKELKNLKCRDLIKELEKRGMTKTRLKDPQTNKQTRAYNGVMVFK